jgi:hypothetical protein
MGAVATTYGMSGPLEQARLAMDVVQNILLPFESAIYTAATSYLMAFAVIVLLFYTMFRLVTAADGEAAAKGFVVFLVVCVLTIPVSVSFDNPFLWHDFGNELSSPTSTYQSGTGTCRGLVDEKDGSGNAPSLPNCGSYKVAFGTLAFFTIANLVEDLLYDAANFGVKALGGGIDDVPAGAYEALSIPPDGLSGNPDTNKLYRSYVDSCTPVAVQDQHSAAPLDPRAWYTVGLLGGGGLGVNLLYLAPTEFSAAANNASFTPIGGAPGQGDYVGAAIPAVKADAEAALDKMASYTPPAVGTGNAINWFHIPTEAYWVQMLKTRAQPATDYQPQGALAPSDQLVPFNPDVAFGSSQVIGANEFASPEVKNYFLSLVGATTTRSQDPPPPSDGNAWYAYNCFDLYALTHIAFENYYNAERQILTDAHTRAFCSTGCVGDPTVVQASEVGTEHEMAMEMEALEDQVEQKNGQTSGAGDAVISHIQAGKSWIGNIFSTYFTLPVVVSTAIGAAAHILAFLFFLSPLIFVAAMIPGREGSIGLWMKSVAFTKTTIFLMYIFVVVGSLLVNWTQINQAAAMWGGHAGSWKYVASTYASQGLIIGGVLLLAPALSFMIVFMVSNKLATHTHHHVNVALSAAGGYIVGRTVGKVVTAGGRGVQQARKSAAAEARADDFRRKSEARFEAGQIAQAQRFSDLEKQTRESFNKMTESLENRGGTLVRKEVLSKEGGKTVTSTFTVGPRQQDASAGSGRSEPPSGAPRRGSDEIFGDVKKMGPEYEEAARTFKPDDDPQSST